MVKTKTDKDGNIIEIEFGPQKKTIKNKGGTKIEISYHLLPTCYDERDHEGYKYKTYFMKKKHYNKEGKLIKEEKGLNPHIRNFNESRLKFYNSLGEKNEKLRKEGKPHYLSMQNPWYD